VLKYPPPPPGPPVCHVPPGVGRVCVQLEDGSVESGDLLIGADGIWSKVRRQMIGEKAPCYSGYTCYTGTDRAGRGGG